MTMHPQMKIGVPLDILASYRLQLLYPSPTSILFLFVIHIIQNPTKYQRTNWFDSFSHAHCHSINEACSANFSLITAHKIFYEWNILLYNILLFYFFKFFSSNILVHLDKCQNRRQHIHFDTDCKKRQSQRPYRSRNSMDNLLKNKNNQNHNNNNLVWWHCRRVKPYKM